MLPQTQRILDNTSYVFLNQFLWTFLITIVPLLFFFFRCTNMDNNWQDIYDICYNAFQTNPASYFWSIMTISVCYFGLVMGVKQWCTKKPQQNKRKRDSFFPISPDNTVYLTRFHFQSWFLLLPLSVLHGMMTYFSHLINLICLFLCLGQIYEYNDFRSFPSLFIFASLHAVMESYEQMSKFKTQKKINLVPVLKFIDDAPFSKSDSRAIFFA